MSKLVGINSEAIAVTKMIRSSPRKLSLVANQIRGITVDKAFAILKFSRRSVSDVIFKTLRSAVSNAENNHQMNVDNLYISDIWVGKNLILRRGRARAKGRYGKIQKVYSQVTLKVREQGNN